MWENMACTVATSFGSHIYNITKLIDKNEVTKDFINRLWGDGIQRLDNI